MIKFKIDSSNFNLDDVVEGLRNRFKSALAATMGTVEQEARNIAASKLRTGLKNWNQGFKVEKVTDDMFLIVVEGQLANWMEDGIRVGEISDAIMKGNRAQHNKAEGKNYVDVPIAKDADSAGNISLGKKGGPVVNVKAFKSADDLMKNINSSDYKKGGIKQKQVIANRVKDIIKNVEPKTNSASYLTIRRVSDKSKWPSSPFAGAKVLDKLDKYIDDNIGQIIERFI